MKQQVQKANWTAKRYRVIRVHLLKTSKTCVSFGLQVNLALLTLSSLLEFRKHWVISFVQIVASKPSKQTRKYQCLFVIVDTPRVLLVSGYFTSFLIPHLCLLLSVHTHLFPHTCFIPEKTPMNCVTQVPFSTKLPFAYGKWMA